jgi:flavin-dependent dehydrogenase
MWNSNQITIILAKPISTEKRAPKGHGEQNNMPHAARPVDVTVIGGGLAGMAASISLAKAGLHVVCVEPDSTDTHIVGESLDWSAPALLKTLGLPMELLIEQGIATYKRHVTLQLFDGSRQHYVPSDWLAQPPFNVELRTMHVDRSRLNSALREIALTHGVTILIDKVVNVDVDRKRITAVSTASGERITSPWFIDASGSAASLFPRLFRLPVLEYGPRKTAMWTYFSVPESVEGTTLYADGVYPPYMEWIWEIPIHSNTVSVGYVTTGDVMKSMRQQGHSVEAIFRNQLARFPRFLPFLETHENITPLVTSFRCRVHDKIAGPNWLVVGESASMVDPMTSNGVTAALRHAAEASSLIIQSRHRSRLPLLGSRMYSRRVGSLAKFFNCGIEKVLYDAPVRNYIGALNAGDVYTMPAWSLNSIYARLRPNGVITTMAFTGVLSLFRAGASLLHRFCKQEQVSMEA